MLRNARWWSTMICYNAERGFITLPVATNTLALTDLTARVCQCGQNGSSDYSRSQTVSSFIQNSDVYNSLQTGTRQAFEIGLA